MSMLKLPAIAFAATCLVATSCVRPAPPPPRPSHRIPPSVTRGFYYDERFVGPPAPAHLRENPPRLTDAGARPAPSPGTAPSSPAQDHPVGRPTSNPNHVISPHEGHNVVDVSEFKSGDLARDPTNGKIFRVP
jgi:hypothetical protein